MEEKKKDKEKKQQACLLQSKVDSIASKNDTKTATSCMQNTSIIYKLRYVINIMSNNTTSKRWANRKYVL